MHSFNQVIIRQTIIFNLRAAAPRVATTDVFVSRLEHFQSIDIDIVDIEPLKLDMTAVLHSG